MTMNKFYFNEYKQDTLKCDWLIGHIISIKKFTDPISLNSRRITTNQYVVASLTKTLHSSLPLNLSVKRVEEEIQLFNDQVDTPRG